MGLSVYYTVPAAYTEASKRAENPVIEMPGRPPPLPHFLRVSKVFPLRSIQGPIFNFSDFWQPGSPARAVFACWGGILATLAISGHPMCTRTPLTPQRLANRRIRQLSPNRS